MTALSQRTVAPSNIVTQLLGFTTELYADRDPSRSVTSATGANQRTLTQLEVLRDALGSISHTYFAAKVSDDPTVLAFMEAACSNVVEGMNIPILWARWAAVEGDLEAIPTLYEPEALDVKHCFERCRVGLDGGLDPTTGTEFLARLQDEHRRIFGHREWIHPGYFKQRENIVGGKLTVPPGQVWQTLLDGFEMCQGAPPGPARASLLEHLIVTVHPFDDGNGRISRLIANNHLSAVGGHRLVMPPTHMGEYVACLRRIAEYADGAPLARWRERMLGESVRTPWRDVREAMKTMADRQLLEIRSWVSAAEEENVRNLTRSRRRAWEREHGPMATTTDGGSELV